MIKQKIYKLLLAVLTVGGIWGVHPVSSLAADTNASTNVSVSVKQPDNQIDKNQSYFDLLMNQGQDQELEVVLKNNTEKDITMLTAVNSAVTNDNGVVDYSWNLEEALATAKKNNENPKNVPVNIKTIAFDSTLKYPLSTFATMDKEVTVPAKSEIITKIKVSMPKEVIPGVIAGGVYLTQKEDSEGNKEESKGVQIKNKFVYVVGIQLRQSEDITGLIPEMKLDKTKILPTQINYRNYLGINLQNIEPVYIRNLNVDAKVYQKGSTEVLHETKQEGLKMAPNSNFNFGVNWENQEFKAGTYRVKVTARAEDYDKEWTWDEEFKIDKDLATKLNNQAIELEKQRTPWWVYILIGTVILLVLLIVVYLIKRHLDKKKEAERLRKLRIMRRRKKEQGRKKNNKEAISKRESKE